MMYTVRRSYPSRQRARGARRGWLIPGVSHPLRVAALTVLPSRCSYMHEYLILVVFYFYPQVLNTFDNFICYFLK
jgi:hypothetical protein